MRIGIGSGWAAVLAVCSACGPGEVAFDEITSELSASQRRARAELIRDIAAASGFPNGALLAGIGDAETGLAHCWSEATWACQGPESPTCNGPVIAGAGDGPCALREGGLGLFQFDGGTFDQTLARDGEAILTLEGNVERAIEFVTAMVIRSQFIDGVDTADQALAFMSSVPIQAGDPAYEAWISTVTRYYNGCSPTSSCWGPRRARYSSLTIGVHAEMGEGFWGDVTPPPPPPPCVPIPAEGRIIDEADGCYLEGGNSSGWRTVSEGHGGQLKWTYTIDGAMDNFGQWNLDLAEAGTYRIEIFTDGGNYFQSRRARYTVVHDGVTEEAIFDQTSGSGFVPLGEYRFAAGSGQSLHLADNTGEPYADRVRIGFDAIRLVRAEAAPPPVEPPPVEPPPVEPPPEEPPPVVEPEVPGGAEVPGEAEVPSIAGAAPLQGALSGGCRCAAPRSSRAAFALPLAGALIFWIRRRTAARR